MKTKIAVDQAAGGHHVDSTCVTNRDRIRSVPVDGFWWREPPPYRSGWYPTV